MTLATQPTTAFTDRPSALGQMWHFRTQNDRAALALSQVLGVPEIVGRVLAGRGITPEDGPSFMAPKLRDDLPDPSLFKDMDKAAERLADAIEDSETTAVFGDYDVDGATSSALLITYFRALGHSMLVHIPDRDKEGYGPNAPALRQLADKGAKVCVTVDCGTTAFEALTAAHEAGLDMIVADHHMPDAALPPAFAVVNPNRLDNEPGFGHLAAVGVVFLLLIALNRVLRNRGVFQDRPEPDLMSLLDIVALGTVADVVPLTGLNRALVSQGLKVMAKWQRPGLQALATVSGIDQTPEAYHLGYLLGPRINAGGRVGASDLGVRVLTAQNDQDSLPLAQQLNMLNEERKTMEAEALSEAIASIETTLSQDTSLPPVIMAADHGWPSGIIGIVAARLKDRYHRPAFVGCIQGDLIKVSGRSMKGIDMGAAVIAAKQNGLLVAGGGHPMAAGLTCRLDDWEQLTAFFKERFSQLLSTMDTTPVLNIDGCLSVGGATADLIQTLNQVGPYGSGNPEPRLIIQNASVSFAALVGESHVRCTLTDRTGQRLNGIAFRCADTPLGALLLQTPGAQIHVAGKLRADYWRGTQRVQIHIDDAMRVSTSGV